MADKPRKILIIRFSSIGDIVLTSPVVRCLYEQLPKAEIHYVTKAKFAPLLQHDPRISKLHTLTEEGLWLLVKSLRRERFDYVVDLHNSLRSRWLRILLAVRGKAFHKLNWQKWLLVRFKVNRIPPLHVVDRYLAAASPLGIVPDDEGLELRLPPNQEKVNEILAGFEHPPAVFAIGGNYPTKQLPVDKIAEVIERMDVPVLLLGGKEDARDGNEIAQRSNGQVSNLCGQLSLLESARVIKESSVVITHDTGMMHIAAAFKKPILSIWGNTVPAFGMTPYVGEDVVAQRKLHRFEVQGLSCRPCSKLGYPACPKGHFKCMVEQNPGHIAETAKDYLPHPKT